MTQDGNDPVTKDAMISLSDTITVNPLTILPEPNECIDSESLDQENSKYNNCRKTRDLEIGGEPKSVSCAKKKLCMDSAEKDNRDCDMGHNQQTHNFVDKKEIAAAISDHLTYNWPRPDQLDLGDANDEESHVKVVHETVQQVMNNLRQQNFVHSVNQIRTLEINSQAALQIVVDLIYKKAVDEPSFSAALTLMCKELAMMQVSGSNSKAGKEESYVDFRKLLITLCQTEFQKINADQNARTIEMQEIEACAASEKKKELQRLLTEEERKIRIKSVGNIRFIGQLFKQGMLTTNIMHRCIRHLLTLRDEKSLESLCILLITIGKGLESKNQNLDHYFKQMLDVVNGEVPLKVSSRVRFMLQDVVELRLNKWVSRRDDSNPKTIDQIQKKAETERLDTQEDNISLQRREKRNRNSDNPRNRGRNSRNGSQQLGSSFLSSYSSPHDTSRSQSMSMALPQPIKSNPPAAPAFIPSKPAAIMTKKQLAKKVAYILEEYLSDTNIKNAASKVRETFDDSTFANFVRKTLYGVVEKSVTARKQVSQLMTHLISENILPMSLYLVGLAEVIDMADDLVLDIPKIWVYLAELILYPLAEGVVPFSELKTTMASLKHKGLAGKLMGELMIMLVQEKSPKWIKDEWDQAGLEWGDFLREDESLNDFIDKYKLEFLFGDGDSGFGNLSAQLNLNMEQIRERLLSLMSDEKENSFDNISSWISTIVSERASEPQLTRVLITANLQVSIEPYNNTFKFRTDKFHNRQTLISRYIKGFVTPQSARESLAPMQSNQQDKPRSNKLAVIPVSSSLREDVKLRETENAWKPGRMKPSEAGEEDIKTEALYKRVRGVLNKLTPQKFATLVNQVRALKIDSQDRLQGVIDLVFEKAVDEPSFSVAYALMCKELATIQVRNINSEAGKEESNVSFRKLIITRCQIEFEKNIADRNARAIRMKEIEVCADPETKKELQHILTENERRTLIKSVGNMRFMGELFKQEMLTTNIMHRCIRHLLTQTDEESLECLCKLLSTIGKDLELKNQFQNLDQYFKQILDIINRKVSGKVSSRVRFMLQDLVELRLNKWVPRRDDSNPKTMGQIQKEAETERFDTHMNNTPLNTLRKDYRNSDRKRYRGWNQPFRNRTQYSVGMSQLRNKPDGEKVHVRTVYETVQQMLNNLKRQNFVESVNQMKMLEINTRAALQIAVDFIHEKAVDEPRFSVPLALMCKELASKRVSSPNSRAGKEEGYVNFRELIITRCRTEFRKIAVNQNLIANEMKDIEACEDPERKKELQHILTEEEKKIRIKFVGNIRFIRELFKQGMMTIDIIHRCIRHLLTQTDEESLKCFCKLLSEIGKDLESKNQNLDEYFKQMQDIVNGKVSGTVTPRGRFLLQDVIELRLNKWISWRVDWRHFTGGKNSRNSSQQLGSSSSSRYSSLHDTSRNQSMSMPLPQPIKSNPPEAPASIHNKTATIMTEEELAKKVAYILEKYLSDTNINNAALEIRETFDNSTFANFVRKSLYGVVENSVTDRKQVSQLMTHLISKNILPMSLYLVGLAEVMDMAEDLVLDIPKIWVYLAELILYPMAEGVVPFSELKTTMAPLKNKGFAGKLMGELMIMLVQEKGPKWIKEEWADLEWGDFLREDESLNDFLKKYSLASKPGSQQGNPRSNKPPVIYVSLSLREDVKLRETENAWKPGRMKPSETGEEDIKTEALYKRVRGVLNKLTPQKFATLVNQVRALKIDSNERLQGVIDLVFEKAVDDPSFSIAYALMCKELGTMQVSGPDSKANKEESSVNFRKLIITRCQMEFEKNTVDETAKAIKMQEIEACANPEEKKELQHILTEEERKIRIKSVGNIRFIGELFKQGMLTTNIMHRCIRHLLTQTDEESLECLCKLLSTIGKKLESKNQNLDPYFKQMLDIVNRKGSGKVSSRVHFILQDVIELRLNKWVPRRNDSNGCSF